MKLKYILLSVLVILVVNLLAGFLFVKDKREKESIIYKTGLKSLNSKYKATKISYKKIIDYVYWHQINTKQIKRNILRKKINLVKKQLLPIYKALTKYNIEKLFIVSLNGETIAGFEYGDFTLKKFKSEKYAGVLYVYPLKTKKKLLGNVYFSIPFSALQDELNSIFEDTFIFIIKKDYALQKLKSRETRSLIPTEFSDNFYYENINVKKLPISLINKNIQEKVYKILNKGQPFSLVYKYNGDYYLISFMTIKTINGKFLGYLISYSKNKAFEIVQKSFFVNMILSVLISLIIGILAYILLRDMERFKHLAETDRLTGLFNKGKFNEVLKREIERARRYKRPLSLIIFDIDHFKRINDTYGHKVGDEVLKELAKLIKKNIRKTDFAARWGGEEFVILAPETDLDGAVKLAEKLRQTVEKHEFPTVKNVTISLGVAQYIDGESPEEFVIRADMALYKAKEGGRNRVEVAN